MEESAGEQSTASKASDVSVSETKPAEESAVVESFTIPDNTPSKPEVVADGDTPDDDPVVLETSIQPSSHAPIATAEASGKARGFSVTTLESETDESVKETSILASSVDTSEEEPKIKTLVEEVEIDLGISKHKEVEIDLGIVPKNFDSVFDQPILQPTTLKANAKADAVLPEFPAHSPKFDKTLSKNPFRELTIEREWHNLEPPPGDMQLLSFWQLKVIRNTITKGGFLTPKIFCPKQVWAIEGSRIPGLASKLIAFDDLLIHCQQLRQHQLEINPTSIKRYCNEVSSFILNCHAIQNALHKPFSFIPEVAVENAATLKEDEKEQGVLGNFWKDVRTLSAAAFHGAKKGASTAIERLGTAAPTRSTSDEIKEYKSKILLICDAFLHFESLWRQFVEFKWATPLISHLQQISTFIRVVINAMLLRDVGALLTRYIDKTNKSFSRSYIHGDSPELPAQES